MPEHNKRIEISIRVERSIAGRQNLTQRRKDAKVEGKTGLAATDVAKAMSVKKDGKERKKECIQ
jgi:hypothetical protein